jgi:hypothetical protein
MASEIRIPPNGMAKVRQHYLLQAAEREAARKRRTPAKWGIGPRMSDGSRWQ